MANQKLTNAELLEQELTKLKTKHEKRLEHLKHKRAHLTAKIEKKFGADPEKLDLEMGIMTIDNDVWIDIADSQLAERTKTLLLKYKQD